MEELIPVISLKRLYHRDFATWFWFCTITLFNLSENFMGGIFAKHFLMKSEASNLYVTTFLKKPV